MLDEQFDRGLMALRNAAGQEPLAVFVDPTLSEPTELHEEWRITLQAAESRGVARWIGLGRIHDNFAPERHPGFFYLHSEEAAERLLSLTVQIAMREALQEYGSEHRDRCVGGWIVNAPGPQALKASLTSLARVLKPEGTHWYLRYWDPRVTWHLPRVLTPQMLQAAHSAMGSWWTVTPLNLLTCAVPQPSAALSSGSSDTKPAASPNAEVLPLRFDQAQWARLQRVGLVNTVLGLAASWKVLPTDGNARRIDDLISRCRQRGFDTEQDALVFSACGLTSHPQFDEQPDVDRALVTAARQGLSVEAAISRFDDEFWTNLASRHPTPENASTP